MRAARYILTLVLGAALAGASQDTPPSSLSLPRSQFGETIASLSEPEGYFDTDNFISNETSYLHVIDELRRTVGPGHAYLGVGPDQNFPYIIHTRPALAIVVDIRRQNMLQHLLYKALFEISGSRAEFLSLLLSRETPKTNARVTLPELLAAVRRSPATESIYAAGLTRVRQSLRGMGVAFSAADLSKIEYVYRTFHEEGLDLRFSSIGRNNAANYPTLQSLLTQTDRNGRLEGYLASEESFLWLKKFQTENRLIPIVGDFAGPKALKAVGAFLRRNNLQVSTFYTSNVEYYVFQDGKWPRYVENLRALPVTSGAVFVRSYFGNFGRHPLNVPGHRSTSLVQSLPELLRNQSAGRIRDYVDIVTP